ncbi:DNA polymerase III subunit delta [Compostibacter hankyongensis]|uniref:DNA polymerase III subunit delta n=1 Tax=Compostibacter hankyongensis TaxID=1007089 RepID=A0ABP8FHY1_9BACT
MSYEVIIRELEARKFKPVYLLEGEEDFFIDQVARYLEHEVLSDAEKEFNLTVFYGKDAAWSDVVNACRRYPMFAERQVVMIKEAQAMRDIGKLEVYLEKPLNSTLLVLVHKQGKLDGRTRVAGLIKKKGTVLTTKKLYDNQLPAWIQGYVKQRGMQLTDKAVLLLADHIGNDLSRMANELDKLLINVRGKDRLDENDIEQYVGISKEYNSFELQSAIARRDLPGAIKIIAYFDANPKAASILMIIPLLHSFFSKLYLLLTQTAGSQVSLSSLGVPPRFQAEYTRSAQAYGREGVERAILLLHTYNLRKIGIDDAGYSDAELLKELVFRIVMI